MQWHKQSCCYCNPNPCWPLTLPPLDSLSLSVFDPYSQTASATAAIRIQPLQLGPNINRGPFWVYTAPDDLWLDGTSSNCMTQPVTSSACNYTWTVACDDRPVFTRTGPAALLTTGPCGD